uniref:Predicted protein n=1 Tax=Hordeum vulgare subsp. vulgare TaxID=112509 RepID=F2CYP6_HORVV|nr:predicted protein [Hordeum vulgare subsp. vulgare]
MTRWVLEELPSSSGKKETFSDEDLSN